MVIMYTPQEIQDWRIEMRLTLSELGQKLGVSESCVAHWESGRTHPRYPTALKLSTLIAEFRATYPNGRMNGKAITAEAV